MGVDSEPLADASFTHVVYVHFALYYFMFRLGDSSFGCFRGKTKSWLVSAPGEARNRFRYFYSTFFGTHLW